jgi:prepilin-type N-terminal cleavage/methylation domain-containing protein
MERTMNHQIRALGLTLVELMAVVAIIALLAGIGAFFVMDSRPNRARADLRNDVETLLHTQRMRATSMNVATYIRFEGGSNGVGFERIVPRIGDVSVCVADAKNQYSIRYSSTDSGEGNNVAIDIVSENKYRTLDSADSSKYAGNIVRIDGQLFQIETSEEGEINMGDIPIGDTLVICFQPNGQAFFIDDTEFIDRARTAHLEIRNVLSTTPETFLIEVTSLGAIQSWSELKPGT